MERRNSERQYFYLVNVLRTTDIKNYQPTKSYPLDNTQAFTLTYHSNE
jgi:hypothetical protein